jgi:hypothetical protein
MIAKFCILTLAVLLFINENECYKLKSHHGLSSWSRAMTATESSTPEEFVFASYVVYKGKGALSIKALPPTLKPGTNNIIAHEGGLLIEMANAISPKVFDWKKKITFLCGPGECGEILSAYRLQKPFEFFHDPNMGGAQAGKVNKKLKFAPDATKTNNFLSLQMTDKETGSQGVSIPISDGEMRVITSIIDYCLPRFLGFDKLWNKPLAAASSTTGGGKQANANQGFDESPFPPQDW